MVALTFQRMIIPTAEKDDTVEGPMYKPDQFENGVIGQMMASFDMESETPRRKSTAKKEPFAFRDLTRATGQYFTGPVWYRKGPNPLNYDQGHSTGRMVRRKKLTDTIWCPALASNRSCYPRKQTTETSGEMALHIYEAMEGMEISSEWKFCQDRKPI